MKRMKHLICGFALFAALASPAWATTSTIDPTVPAENSLRTSAQMRGQFVAAYNDINNLWTSVATQAPGGSGNQVQFKSGSGFGGFTMGGDCTLNVSTGVVTCTKSSGNTILSGAFSPIGTSGAAIGLLNVANVFSGVQTFTAAPKITFNSSSLPTAQATSLLQVANANSTAGQIECDGFSAGCYYSSIGFGGTASAPTALPSGQEIGGLVAAGYNGSGVTGARGGVTMSAAQTWTNISTPTYGSVKNTPIGSTVPVENVRFENDGGVTIPPTVTGGDQGAGSINATAIYQAGQPLVASALTDTTNASNISSGTLAYQRFPALIGDATLPAGSNTTSISAATVTGKALTGLSIGTGTVTSADSILSSIGKIVANMAAEVNGVSSVYGRAGAVTAQTGDYTVSQVTGAAPIASPTFTGTATAGSFSGAGTGLTGTASGLSIGGNASTVTTNANLTGDVTSTGNATTLATVNSNTGSIGSSTAIPNFTVNGKGLIIAAGTNAVVAPAGTLTGSTLASGVTASSLTSIGTLAGLTVTAPITGSVTGNAGTVTTNANMSGVVTSSGNTTSFGSFTSSTLAGAISDETGTGAAVFANTPTLVTPVLGAATGTSVNLSGAATALNLNATGTGANVLPVGTTGQRPTVAEGQLRDNSTLHAVEAYLNGGWQQIVSSASGLVGLTTQVTGTLPIANGGTNGTTAYGSALNLGVQGYNIASYGAVNDVTVKTGLTLTSGSPTVTISGLTSAQNGHPIVFYIPNTTNVFQTTILSVSGTTVTLNANATFNASATATAYTGTDSTTAINAAFTAAIAAPGLGSCVYIPNGSYFYNGTGATGWQTPCIYGDGQNTSTIYQGSTVYLVNLTNGTISMNIHDIGVFGGAGDIRNSTTSAQVGNMYSIYNNKFTQFSRCAVSFNSPDMPNINLTDNYFYGLNTSQSMGFCTAGQGPIVLLGNAFANYRAAIKIGNGGLNDRILYNDFVQGSEENPTSQYTRAAIWVVPDTSSGNGSIALMIQGNKFGNENLDTQDVRVLLADSIASGGGNLWGDTLWLTTASTGFITGMQFDNNLMNGGTVGGTGSGANPIIYSYTPNFRFNKVSAVLAGTNPGYALQFDGVVTVGNDYTITSNVFGPFLESGTGIGGPAVAADGQAIQFALTNLTGLLGTSSDNTGDIEYADGNSLAKYMTGTSAAGYVNLLTKGINAFTLSGSETKTQITDADGGTDAATVTTAATGAGNQIYSGLLASPTLGAQNWCDVDLRQGSSGTSVSSLVVQIADSFSNPLFLSKPVTLAATWHRYHFPFVIRVTPAHTPPNIQFNTASSFTATGDTFDIGRVRCYSAPQAMAGNMTTLPFTAQSYNTTFGGRAFNTGTTADTIAAGKASTYESANSVTTTITYAAPIGDGEVRKVCFKNATTVTWAVTAPATAQVGLPTTITAGACVSAIYNAVAGSPTGSAATTWYPY